jgi:uncharacterized membrane protein
LVVVLLGAVRLVPEVVGRLAVDLLAVGLTIGLQVGAAAVAVVLILLWVFRKQVRQLWMARRVFLIQKSRYAMQVALALGLVIIGFELLYVQQATGFIGGQVHPVVQYLFWGLGSDVASRTLASMKGAGGPT